MKRVLATTFVAQAEMARVLLRKNRIPSMIEGDAVGIRGPATPIQVWVADGHYDRAAKLVHDFFTRKTKKKKPAARKKAARKRKPAKRKAPRASSRKAAPKRKKRR